MSAKRSTQKVNKKASSPNDAEGQREKKKKGGPFTWIKRILLILFTIVALALIAVLFLLSGKPESYEKYQTFLNEYDTSERTKMASDIEKKVMSRTAWSVPEKSDTNKQREIVLLEDDCNAWFKERFPRWHANQFGRTLPGNILDTTLFFHDGYAILGLLNKATRGEQWISLKITNEATDGLKVRISEAKVGNLPLPQEALKKIIQENAEAQNLAFFEDTLGEGFTVDAVGANKHLKVVKFVFNKGEVRITLEQVK